MGRRDNGVKHTLVWCYREVVLSKHTEKGEGMVAPRASI